MGFPTAFANGPLRKTVRNFTRDAKTFSSGGTRLSSARAVTGATFMASVGLLNYTLRTGGKNFEQLENGEITEYDLLERSLQYSGLLGPAEYYVRYSKAARYESKISAAIGSVVGPNLPDVYDYIKGFFDRGVVAETAYKRSPFIISLKSLHPEAYKKGLEYARELDKQSPLGPEGVEKKEGEVITSGKKFFSKGGIVEGEDNVPFTKEDPADRINPYTGEPYQEQMSRLGFQEGGPKLSSDQKMYLTFYNMAREAGVAYPAAVAAQASLESGHGTSELATKYNNPLGIKVNRPSEIKQGQPSVKVKTKEFVEGKEGTEIEPFRIYNNLSESFVGYKEKVAAPRYDSIRQAKNEDEYLTAIATSGYATDPLYAEKTIDIKNRYANLIPKD